MISTPYFILPGENGFKNNLLDELLAAGYYRMLHTMFTTNHTQFNLQDDAFAVFWLRTRVRDIQENKGALVIRKKCSAFNVSCKKASVSMEAERLYHQYLGTIDFSTGGSIYACIHDSSIADPFDTYMIEVRDNGELIAAGYFDKGVNAITGILNFYHPAYKRYSLGKYLMLKKIDFARENNIGWYYTGYIGSGTAKFDYKLFPDVSSIEVYLPVEKVWIPYSMMGKEGLKDYWLRYKVN